MEPRRRLVLRFSGKTRSEYVTAAFVNERLFYYYYTYEKATPCLAQDRFRRFGDLRFVGGIHGCLGLLECVVWDEGLPTSLVVLVALR